MRTHPEVLRGAVFTALIIQRTLCIHGPGMAHGVKNRGTIEYSIVVFFKFQKRDFTTNSRIVFEVFNYRKQSLS